MALSEEAQAGVVSILGVLGAGAGAGVTPCSAESDWLPVAGLPAVPPPPPQAVKDHAKMTLPATDVSTPSMRALIKPFICVFKWPVLGPLPC